MSMIAMVQPTAHPAFKREFTWDDTRRSDFASRTRVDSERIALPSIHQIIPDLELRINAPDASARSPSSTSSPRIGHSGARTSPEYALSPNSNKRRRMSIGEDPDERSRQIPRLYGSPPRDSMPRPGPSAISPIVPPRSGHDSWPTSSRTSPYLPSIRSPATLEIPEPRSAAPTLSVLTIPRMRSHSGDDYPSEVARPLTDIRGGSPAIGYHSHPYHHPTRSFGSVHYDRTPFSPATSYGAHYPDYVQLGGLGIGGDNKQRKRRGNLPKETTDKLRAWFVAHLSHPYPTEDEKQDLMRQTGLQMNQISNWFINARRRQLPTMINNARAESDAVSSVRSTDAKVTTPTERHAGDHDKLVGRASLSDRGVTPSDDEVEADKRRDAATLSRGSV